jgi:tetratricopeptide (TPR) repeat protein
MQFTVKNKWLMPLLILCLFFNACGQSESERIKLHNQHTNKATALREQGKLEEAIEEQKKAVEMLPDDGKPLMVLATLYIDLYEKNKVLELLEKANNLLEKAVKLEPEDAIGHQMLSLSLERLGNKERALIEMKKAVQIQPADLENQVNLGAILENLEKFNEARETFGKVLQKNPNYIYGLYHFAELEFKEKNYPKAMELFERAIKVKPAEDGSDVKYIEICKQRLEELKKLK